jgi:hypothetical protein
VRRTGDVIQRVIDADGAVATGTTQTPDDDSIPQITEGTEFLSVAITPKDAANILLVECNFVCASDGTDTITVALHQDAVANARVAVGHRFGAASFTHVQTIKHYRLAETTSAQTYRIRAGHNGAATITFNGESSARKYGGASNSVLAVTEVCA